MIQKTNARHGSTAVAPMRQAVTTEVPEQWGQWIGRKHYSLEVTQHPIRARMCGFGDKDRRPLAPAVVAKMVVRLEDNSIVDVYDLDCSFFLVTVDLWSADGSQEMNLVLHPSSSDRYAPTNTSKSRRRGMSFVGPPQRSSHQSPATADSTPTPSQYTTQPDNQPGGTHSALAPPTHSYNNQGYPFNQSIPAATFQTSQPYTTPPDQHPTWGYNTSSSHADRDNSFPPTVLPSIHSFGRANAPSSILGPGVSSGPGVAGDPWNSSNRDEAEPPYRGWHTEPSYPGMGSAPFNASSLDPALRGSSSSFSHPDSRESWGSIPNISGRSTQSSFANAGPSTQPDNQVYASASYTQQPPPPIYPSPYTQNASSSASTIPPLPRHSYTRTLVGPLSANACRLMDEHRKPGIFFLFQDLSVRTEGTFRLRLRLMNVGAPPAPEGGAVRVHTGVSPVLAQTFTEPFEVWSAKKFPGVPDTTALSIAFGNQGQKLPLRNRHGSSKHSQRRRQRDSDGSDDGDSDGT